MPGTSPSMWWTETSDITVNVETGFDITCEIRLDESAAAMKPDMRTANLWPHFRGVDGMPAAMTASLSPKSAGFLRPDGKFQLAHAPRGRFRLEVSLPAGSGLYVSAARFGGQDILGQLFEISENATGPLVIELSGSGSSLLGTVTDSAGKPAAETLVWIVPAANFRGDPTAYRGTLTDSQGRFSIVAIRPGTYTAFALARTATTAGAVMNPEYMAQYLNFGTPLDLPKGQLIRQELRVITLPR